MKEMKINHYYELIGYTDYYLLRDQFNLYWVYSFKNFNKYPFGYRIEPNKNRKGYWYFKLSNDAGDYVKITVDKLIEVALNPSARIYPAHQPPRPQRRRTVVISSKSFDYNETPKIIDRSTSLKDKIGNNVITGSIWGNLTNTKLEDPIPNRIDPFSIVKTQINSIFNKLLE